MGSESVDGFLITKRLCFLNSGAEFKRKGDVFEHLASSSSAFYDHGAIA